MIHNYFKYISSCFCLFNFNTNLLLTLISHIKINFISISSNILFLSFHKNSFVSTNRCCHSSVDNISPIHHLKYDRKELKKTIYKGRGREPLVISSASLLSSREKQLFVPMETRREYFRPLVERCLN